MSLADPTAPAEAFLLAVPIHDPAPPAPYSTWVWVLGLALIAAIALWYVFVSHNTRPRPAPDLPKSHWTNLRQGALTKVDAAEQAYRDGHADLRELHLTLNTVLRDFASERLGRDASWMTVAELADLEGTDRLATLLGGFQEPAFAADSDALAMSATASAREVIRAW